MSVEECTVCEYSENHGPNIFVHPCWIKYE